MLLSIKKFFLKKYLSENKPNRQIRMVNLPNAKTIGLLCEITDEDSYKDIYRVFSHLQEQGHQVKLIGYINEKEVPFYCLPQLTADYFCQKHLNWYGLPNMEQVRDSLKTQYDMLVDFNCRYHAAIETFLSLSHARFIVGRASCYQQQYDLFIDAEKCSNAQYLETVGIYTQKLTGNER